MKRNSCHDGAELCSTDHLSQFIVALVRESLDLSELFASYTSGLDQPTFDSRMMTSLLLNG
jgi:hypothetical protein